MFARKALFSSHRPRRRGGDCCGGGADRGRAVAWLAPGPRPPGKGLSTATRPATPLTSAPGAQLLSWRRWRRRGSRFCRHCRHRHCDRRRARTVATTITMAALRPITVAARPITVGSLLRQSAVLWRRIWLSPVRRACYFNGHPIGRLVIAASSRTALIRRPLGCGRRISCFATIGNRPLTRWPRVWISFRG